MLLDGSKLATERRGALKKRVEGYAGKLTLGVIVATNDPAVLSYDAGKKKAAEEVGFDFVMNDLGPAATKEELLGACRTFNEDPTITGYIVQTPLPAGIDPVEIFAAVEPAKDADGLTPGNLARLFLGQGEILPATPRGILTLLESVDVAISGQIVTVIGKSILVGLPIATILAQRGATVISCDSKTPDLGAQTRQADIVISATGQPKLLTRKMVKEGVVVIDVGIARTEGGLVGDVDYASVAPRAALITPVPGGVGPMTVVSLLENVWQLHELTPPR